MVVNNLKLLVGGVQLRDGVTTVTDILGKMFVRAGLHVLAMEKGYASTIYGAHQYDPMVVSATPPLSYGDDRSDVLVALEFDTNPDAPVQPNRDTILRHGKNLADGGVLLYDSTTGTVDTAELERRGVKVFPLPARQIALRELKREVVKNTVVTGALLRLLEFDMDLALFRQYLEERFGRKGREIVELNLEAARRGRAVIEEVLRTNGWADVGYRLVAQPTSGRSLLLNGNDALGMGAILAGCRFYAGYPITPASAILEFMEAHLPRYGGRALQGQNERESIRAAIGAALTGVRSAIGSSGPGISLKVEEFGVAGVTETPIVIIDTQRAGPSTGMPTKPEQGDLAMAVFAGHGEIPRIVLAAGTVEECYTLAFEAFDLADKYQCPVFLLSDLTLADGRRDVPEEFFLTHRRPVTRWGLLREADLRQDGYRRYQITESGISPRNVPGVPGGIFKSSGSEHDELGMITTDPPKRKAMFEKRMRKMQTYLKEDAKPPLVFGTPDGVPLLVGWGSTRLPLLDAQARLRAEGMETCVVHFTHLWPFPTHLVRPLLQRGKDVIVVEQNYAGQLADLIQQECLLPTRRILKYNGRPFYTSDITGGVRQLLVNGTRLVRVGDRAPAVVLETVPEGD
ncbi:MAG: 2-oxoacid:acceptor oxidoreductase subunit alpha [Armatimonadota bacterium]|nr:2-oxoacid:acceptor oxidoreductase subunit alpha [Armatimonadota bacterium]